MKIRAGYVSNSSTSSFLIYGIHPDDDDIEKAAEKIGIKEANSFYDLCCELAEKIGVEHEEMDDVDHYFGISPRMIEDDETGLQFKKRVEELLVSAFGDEIKCTYYEESWRDG